MTIVLRYRDLTVPEGATIERHREIIEREGIVMWGWMMRQSERVPRELLTQIAENPEKFSIYLYDAGSCEIRRATLKNLSMFPGGIRIPTPIPRSTPSYMAEALCPVWFHFSDIEDNPIEVEGLMIEDYPTLQDVKEPDKNKLREIITLNDLRETGATVWVASIVPNREQE